MTSNLCCVIVQALPGAEVYRVMCGGCGDFKIITNQPVAAHGAWGDNLSVIITIIIIIILILNFTTAIIVIIIDCVLLFHITS